MSTPALEVRDLWVSLSGTSVLEAIDITVEEGGYLGIIGPNGAGKSVLLETILGLRKPDRGSIRLFGRSPKEARPRVGYVPQHAAFDRGFPISVLQVVRMSGLGKGLRRFARSGADDRERALAALERVRMAEFADRQIGELSGGQRQRVLIARALAVKARLLILDEPSANLDSRAGAELHELLAGLVPEVTVVLVSHDLGAIVRHVESVACLDRRMHFHSVESITPEMIESAYHCPVDLVAHRHVERVSPPHHERA
jgi:zinc transport system ATP-binding protein